MNQAVIAKRISRISSDINCLNGKLCAMGAEETLASLEQYEALSTEAALLAEKIACRLRRLIFSTTRIKAAEYLSSAASVQGIEVRERDGIVEITLPVLLPKRKQQVSAKYLLAPFQEALHRFVRERPVRRFKECTICFAHIYDRSCPDRRIRDYDNMEQKQLLDMAAAYLLTDDSGLLCDTYNTTELGDADCTRILIMEKNRFPQWLAGQ